MSTLVIMRGLPASGKTTYARKWVAEDPGNRARVNRDDLRAMVHNGVYIAGVTESQIINARDFLILGLLHSSGDVICDDTNLDGTTMRGLKRLAAKAGSDYQIVDLTSTPLEECLARNAARTDKKPVPEAWIREQHLRYISQQEPGVVLPNVVY